MSEWQHDFVPGDLVRIGAGLSVWQVSAVSPDLIRLVANRSLGPFDGRFLPTRNVKTWNINRLSKVDP